MHQYSDGCYEWIKPHIFGSPSEVTTALQLYDDGVSGEGKQAGDSFYQNSLNQTGANGKPAMIVGAAYKGFDDYMASWWTDRIISQECGQSWFYSWEEMTWNGSSYGGSGAYYGPNNPLNYMLVETWDDYEEGTETETGISNCVEDSSFAITLEPGGQTLAWSYNFTDSTYGTPSTVDHYALYYTTDDQNYYLIATVTGSAAGCRFSAPNVTGCTINLANFTWETDTTYTLYVQAVGVPGVTNNMSSNSVSYMP